MQLLAFGQLNLQEAVLSLWFCHASGRVWPLVAVSLLELYLTGANRWVSSAGVSSPAVSGQLNVQQL